MFVPLITIRLLGPSMIVEGTRERDGVNSLYSNLHSTSTMMVELAIPAGLLTVIV